MKARIDCGTDIAMIGAWDAQRSAIPFTAMERKRHLATLDADAAAGHLFLVRTGADGGGPIDLYVDEEIPAESQEGLVPLGGDFLLALPSGALVVAGVEHYRFAEPAIAAAAGVVTVPAGDYVVRSYRPSDEERSPPSEAALEALVGSAELEYYDRVNRRGCLGGGLTLLLFPILSFALGWKIAIVLTVAVFLAYFPVRARLLQRQHRYRRLHEIVPVFRLQHQNPAFVFVFRSIRDRADLVGGSVSVTA